MMVKVGLEIPAEAKTDVSADIQIVDAVDLQVLVNHSFCWRSGS